MFESPRETLKRIMSECKEKRADVTRINKPLVRKEGRNLGEEEDGRPKEKTSKDPVETGPWKTRPGPENKIR
ncbi:hypothetical protein NDU88_004297 [Pleurodeles waltl]|uniref:Uncharacterized protein n=1 Tax=Pleurodeles waltl TaxID=8319 RepID=A0AAV7SIH7_PLEWA|nr:hypothetical protein NDU88_004297 [Pleurodeles waltl]